MSQNELQRVVAEMRDHTSRDDRGRCNGMASCAELDDWADRIEAAHAVAPGGGEWPDYVMLRDTKLHDDQGGLGQRIFTTAGAGYKKVKYVRADIAAAPASEAKGQPVVCTCHTERERTLCRKRKECVVAYASGNQAAASSAVGTCCANAGTFACKCNKYQPAEQEQAGELPDRVWIPGAVVASYSRKPLPGDNPRIEFVRRAARVGVTPELAYEIYRKLGEVMANHRHRAVCDRYMAAALAAALEPKE